VFGEIASPANEKDTAYALSDRDVSRSDDSTGECRLRDEKSLQPRPGLQHRIHRRQRQRRADRLAHGSDQELDAAHTLAVNRCTLFGKSSAVLESVNPRTDGKDRASYICQ
jgi:hypothetical protein